MDDRAYQELAEALDRLPNGYPRTDTGIEIDILERIFSPEQASVARLLDGTPAPVAEIAERAALSADELGAQLIAMARRGLVWVVERSGEPCFRLAPFIVGIYEAQVELMDHELAHLVEEYLHAGGAAGIMKPQPALHRVMPTDGSVPSEWILPYDDVREVMLSAETFSVRDCICRLQQDELGNRCESPMSVCLSFSNAERDARPGDISRDDALRLLEQTEEAGLVHTVSNVMKGVGYICNCCGCCCGILRGITDFGIEDSVAHANYYAVIDEDDCTACGTCIERCQVGAIIEEGGVSVVVRDRCIGCGLCVTGCPDQVPLLYRKSEDELVLSLIHI